MKSTKSMKFVKKFQLSLLTASVVAAVAVTAAAQIGTSGSESDNNQKEKPETLKPSQRNTSGPGRVIYQDDFTNAAE